MKNKGSLEGPSRIQNVSVFITIVSPKGNALIPNEGREGGKGAGVGRG